MLLYVAVIVELKIFYKKIHFSVANIRFHEYPPNLPFLHNLKVLYTIAFCLINSTLLRFSTFFLLLVIAP